MSYTEKGLRRSIVKAKGKSRCVDRQYFVDPLWSADSAIQLAGGQWLLCNWRPAPKNPLTREVAMVQPSIDEIVKSIASDTNTPLEVVAKMYEATWAEFSDGARIMDFLTVLVIKRVREDLRNGKAGRYSGSDEQVNVAPLGSQGEDDHQRAFEDREADKPPSQTPDSAQEGYKEHCSGSEYIKEVHEYVRVARSATARRGVRL
jgi:hypothetical protein